MPSCGFGEMIEIPFLTSIETYQRIQPISNVGARNVSWRYLKLNPNYLPLKLRMEEWFPRTKYIGLSLTKNTWKFSLGWPAINAAAEQIVGRERRERVL